MCGTCHRRRCLMNYFKSNSLCCSSFIQHLKLYFQTDIATIPPYYLEHDMNVSWVCFDHVTVSHAAAIRHHSAILWSYFPRVRPLICDRENNIQTHYPPNIAFLTSPLLILLCLSLPSQYYFMQETVLNILHLELCLDKLVLLLELLSKHKTHLHANESRIYVWAVCFVLASPCIPLVYFPLKLDRRHLRPTLSALKRTFRKMSLG